MKGRIIVEYTPPHQPHQPHQPSLSSPAANSRYTPPSSPAAREVTGVETATVDWDGVKVTVPATGDDLDPDAIEAFEQGKAVSAIRSVLGSDHYDAIRSDWGRLHGRRPVLSDIARLVEAVVQVWGFESKGE